MSASHPNLGWFRGLPTVLGRPGVQLGLLVAIALAVRLTVVLSLARLPWFDSPKADSEVYVRMGRAFAAGDWLIGHEPLRMSPAYPFFLGAVYRLLGDGALPIRLVQIALGLALVALTWDTARRVTGGAAALVAGGAIAVFGPLIFYEAQLLGDAPAAAVAGFSLWMMVRAVQQREARLTRWTMVGLSTGGVVLFRPNALLLVVPLSAAALWVQPGGRRARRLLAAAIVGFLLGVLPVSVRNLIATGRPTLIAAHGGINLYVGNGPGATGSFRVPAELPAATGPEDQYAAFRAAAERAEGRPLDAAAADRYWTRRTLAFIREHPVDWLALLVTKLRLFWNGGSMSDIEHYEFTRRLDRLLDVAFLQWWALMPFAVAGTVMALRARTAAGIVALFNLSWCASLVLVFVVDRYRLAALSGLSVAAAVALREGVSMWLQESRVVRAGLVALAAASVAIAWPIPVEYDDTQLWRRLASDYERLGRSDEAQSAFRRALEIAPDRGH